MIYFPSATFQVYRNRPQGNSKYSYSATFTFYSGDFQPNQGQRQDAAVGRITKAWTAFVDVTVDVKEGDKIVTDDRSYWVKGVSKWEGAGLLDHIQLDLESSDG